MSAVNPVVRHMLLCDDVQSSPQNPLKVNILGLLSRIHVAGTANFPNNHSFAAYLSLTGGRGSGDGQIVVEEADTQQSIYVGHPHRINFSSDPLELKGVVFRVSSCSLPKPGLFWVQFWYNDELIHQEPLHVGYKS